MSPEDVWGRDVGYCAWCVDEFVDDEPIWEHEIDSQGNKVRYACCFQCAIDREVIANIDGGGKD
jgi:hypothetical protein